MNKIVCHFVTPGRMNVRNSFFEKRTSHTSEKRERIRLRAYGMFFLIFEVHVHTHTVVRQPTQCNDNLSIQRKTFSEASREKNCLPK